MILEINTGSGYQPIACLTAVNESEQTETMGTTTRQNGGWKTTFPTIQGKGLSGQGIVPEDGAAYSYNVLKNLKRNKTSFTYRIDGEVGTAILTDISLSGDADGDLAFSFEMKVQGEPT